VIVVGVDPLTFLMAGNSLPTRLRVRHRRRLRGRPLKVVKGRVTRTAVPGRRRDRARRLRQPGNTRLEGPFGNGPAITAARSTSPGARHQGDLSSQRPDHPRLPAAAPAGRKLAREAILRSALIREDMHKAGVPGVTAVWAHESEGRAC